MDKELENKTLRILLTCPECNNSTFMYDGGDWKCLECGEIAEIGDLSTTPMDEQELEQIFTKRKEFEQTLIKIREVALGVRNYLNCPSPKDVRYEMDVILQKISEVIKWH